MTVKTLEKMIFCVLDIHIWSGRKKLRAEDLKDVTGSQLPPGDLASLGSKKICDPDALLKFHRLKRQAIKTLEEEGVTFLNGFGVPEERMQSKIKKLDSIKEEFKNKKTAFLTTYYDEIEQWIKTHKEWEAIIRSAITPKEVVSDALSFEWTAFRIHENGAVDGVDLGINKAVNGLGSQLIRETAEAAKKAFEKSFAKRDEVTHKAIRPIIAIRRKLNSLSFLDDRILSIVQHIDAVISSIPKTGKIGGKDLSLLKGLVLMLSDEKKIISHAEKLGGETHVQIMPAAVAEDMEDISDMSEDALDESEVADGIVDDIRHDNEEHVVDHGQTKEPASTEPCWF